MCVVQSYSNVIRIVEFTFGRLSLMELNFNLFVRFYKVWTSDEFNGGFISSSLPSMSAPVPLLGCLRLVGGNSDCMESSSNPTPPLTPPTARCERGEDDGDSVRVKGGAHGVLLGHLSYGRPKTAAGYLCECPSSALL